ncbi:hypothetical protein O0L34_g13694 [Tuta absoluta]|nr:hypothetical protein O0L34_g13694 [Tuta absoluta]
MKLDIPEFKQCCVCVPLRYGLLIWSYLILGPLGFTLFYVIPNEITVLLLALGNIAVTVLLIIAAHEKSLKLLKIYNKCALGAVIATFIGYMFFFLQDAPRYGFDIFTRSYIVNILLGGLIFTAMQVYIIALVRGEIKKLAGNIDEEESVYNELEKAIDEPEMVIVTDQKFGSKTAVNNESRS